MTPHKHSAGGTREIPLPDGSVALVDESDYERVAHYAWQIHKKHGYVQRRPRVGGRRPRMALHRFILGVGPAIEVDHRNQDKRDNRRSNLRACGRRGNLANRSGDLRRHGRTSRYRGVRFRKECGKRPWQAIIQIDGHQRCLGAFATEREAASAWDAAALAAWGEFARLNLPQEATK